MRELCELLKLEEQRVKNDINTLRVKRDKEKDLSLQHMLEYDLIKKCGELDGIKQAVAITVNFRRFIETGHK